MHPQDLLGSFHSSNVLCLSGRQSDPWLKLATPVDCARSYANKVSTCRATRKQVHIKVYIVISAEQLWFRRVRFPQVPEQMLDSKQPSVLYQHVKSAVEVAGFLLHKTLASPWHHCELVILHLIMIIADSILSCYELIDYILHQYFIE